MYAHAKLDLIPPASAADQSPQTTRRLTSRTLRGPQDTPAPWGGESRGPQCSLAHRGVRSIHVRLKPLASVCKQTPQPRSDRYILASPPCAAFPSTNHDLRVSGSGDEPESRRAVSARCRDTNHAFLPGTLCRVETYLSHRKQKIADASTRNVPAHTLARDLGWRVGVTAQKSSCARKLTVCYSVGVPPRGTRATAPARPSQQWRPSPAHFLRSAIASREAIGTNTGRHSCAL